MFISRSNIFYEATSDDGSLLLPNDNTANSSETTVTIIFMRARNIYIILTLWKFRRLNGDHVVSAAANARTNTATRNPKTMAGGPRLLDGRAQKIVNLVGRGNTHVWPGHAPHRVGGTRAIDIRAAVGIRARTVPIHSVRGSRRYTLQDVYVYNSKK